MSSLTIYKDNYSECTAICNRFIDEYMIDANDAQIKVYLYLIRMMSANRETDISDMADKFNHTEKDILRSLKYWEKKRLLSLEYDGPTLTGIRLTDPEGCSRIPERQPAPIVPIKLSPESAEKSVAPERVVTPERVIAPERVLVPVNDWSVNRTYSRDELKNFKDNPETGQLLFIAETYLNRQLAHSDIETLYFIRTELSFTCELVDYLLQYCISKDKKSFAYIRKVAIDWAENGITTVRQAKAYVRSSFDKSVYTVMKLLGRNSVPTVKEAEIITKWSKEYCFTMEIIEEACNRTVLATDSHRLEYCDKVLSSWKQKGIRDKLDITAADNTYKKSKTVQTSKNSFNQFQQNDYDFAALEQKLLSN